MHSLGGAKVEVIESGGRSKSLGLELSSAPCEIVAVGASRLNRVLVGSDMASPSLQMAKLLYRKQEACWKGSLVPADSESVRKSALINDSGQGEESREACSHANIASRPRS